MSQLQARAPEAGAHLPNYCPMAMFLHQLLSLGYRFNEHAFSRVTFQKKVGAGRGAGAEGGPGRRVGRAEGGLRAAWRLRLCPSPQAGDTTVGWALGYMLNLTNMIPADPPGLRKATAFSSWVALLLLFTALLLAALVLLLCKARPAKSPSAI